MALSAEAIVALIGLPLAFITMLLSCSKVCLRQRRRRNQSQLPYHHRTLPPSWTTSTPELRHQPPQPHHLGLFHYNYFPSINWNIFPPYPGIPPLSPFGPSLINNTPSFHWNFIPSNPFQPIPPQIFANDSHTSSDIEFRPTEEPSKPPPLSST